MGQELFYSMKSILHGFHELIIIDRSLSRSLYMNLSQRYYRITEILKNIVLFAPLLNMRRCTVCYYYFKVKTEERTCMSLKQGDEG